MKYNLAAGDHPRRATGRHCESDNETVAMILGISTAAFTSFHVLLSLIGIVAGGVVAVGLRGAKTMPNWTLLFSVTTVATSVTGPAIVRIKVPNCRRAAECLAPIRRAA
jgi:hypothetical protein